MRLYMMEQSAGYAETLINMVSLIAGGLLFGLHRTFMNSASVMLGSMQRSVISEADQDAKGDFALANTSIGNHSWNNVSANKFDTNTTHFAGSMTRQLADGATSTITPGGEEVINSNGALSQLPLNLNFAKSLAASFQSSSDHAHQAALQEQSSYNTAISDVASSIASYASTTTDQASYGEGHSMSDNSSYDQSMATMHNLAHDAAQSLGITDDQAARAMTQLSLNERASVDLRSDNSVLGKVAAWVTGADVSAGMSASAEQQGTTSHAHSINDGTSLHTRTSRLDEFRSAMHTAQNYASNQHIEQGASKSDALAHQFSSNLNKASTASHNMSVDQSESARMSKMASQAKQQSINLNQNLSQEFANYVHERAASNEQANNILSNVNTKESNQLRNQIANDFLKGRQTQVEQWLSKHESPGEIAQVTAKGRSLLNQQTSIHEQHHKNQQQVEHKGAGVSFNQNQLIDVQKEVASHHANSNKEIRANNSELINEANQFKQQSHKRVKGGAEEAEIGAAHQALDNTVTYFKNKDIKMPGDKE